ncbi:hypothetical protein QYF61_021270 [Mycteria americana]|uniref:Ig-like domain-containing protein n=1 Tax=Mycteria americana TaxID=33587 RepID=A0AAN7RSY8_MYCAM|nr:hypothetical protein QYF61_021269 [Mycteria americana]KAK4806674.1 hypothetical protein QYF61_021270 [Mycteria americana]
MVSTGMGPEKSKAFCVLDTSNAGLGHPCAMSPGDLPAPVFYMNTFHAQDGEQVFFHCSIDWHTAATRIVFCKDGVEAYSLKAQQGQLSYFMVLNVTRGSSGTYTCGYQHRNESNWVRSSALSASRNLTVTGETWHWGTGRHRSRPP